MTTLNPVLIHLLAQSDPEAANRREVRMALQEQMLALSFQAFEEIVKELLTRLGYQDARLLGRTQWRQFTRHGGTDMEAFIKVGLSTSQVVLQVKQYRRPVSRRFVDELCGAMLRSGAREGMVITTSDFSRVARKSAQSQQVATIRLINGKELIDLLMEQRIGVLCDPSEGEEVIALDPNFFQALHRRFPDRRRLPTTVAKPNAKRLTPETTLSRLDSLTKPTPMLWRTHFLAGVNSLWLLYLLPGVLTAETLPLAIGLAAFGSLLPDLDAVDNKVKHLGAWGMTPFAPISRAVNRALGHRGLMHSPITLVPVAFVSVVLSFWIGVVPGISLLLGYGSHLFMDALTRSGISLVPFSETRLHLLPTRLRIVTGSVQEDILMLVLGFLAALLLLRFFPFA